MSLPLGRYRFNGSTLEPSDSSGALPLYVADSWLTVDGATIALEKHFTRFANSAQEQGLVQSPGTFLSQVAEALEQQGVLNPRIELTVRGELMLWLRPAPERKSNITLCTVDMDPRQTPGIKGPDIPALEALRTEARERGADEAVITTASGEVIDGSTTCLLWWRNDQVNIPPLSFTRLSSVTMQVLSELFAASQISIAEEAARPADLADLEVWAVNALHGIRPVTRWTNGPTLSPVHPRADFWRSVYEAARQA
jgi:branched-subunit amino acid aminotransferase/4-amino-4-deoxychorismate lyase